MLGTVWEISLEAAEICVNSHKMRLASLLKIRLPPVGEAGQLSYKRRYSHNRRLFQGSGNISGPGGAFYNFNQPPEYFFIFAPFALHSSLSLLFLSFSYHILSPEGRRWARGGLFYLH